MAAVLPPPNEVQRLARLRQLAVLDTAPEPIFDQLAGLAADLCGTPIALVSLVDADRQWIKADVGLGARETAREHAFCAHTLHQPAILEVPDATRDRRFADNPLVLGAPHIRFYAGAPIVLDDGTQPGTLCVIDREPRRLTEQQRRLLVRLADTVAETLMLRERKINEAVLRAMEAQLESEERFKSLAERSPLGVYQTDAAGRCLYTNPAWQRIYGLSAEDALGLGWARALHPEDAQDVQTVWEAAVATGQPFELSFRLLRDDGRECHVLSRAQPVLSRKGRLVGFVGNVEDRTLQREAEAALAESRLLLDRTGRLAAVGGWRVNGALGLPVWSDEACRLHERPPGYRPTLEEALSVYDAEGRAAIEAAYRRARQSGEGWDLELALTTHAGTRRWVRSQGEVEVTPDGELWLQGAIQDISAQHALMQELEQHRERLRSMYESTPAYVHALSPEGRLLGVSDDWLAWLGYLRHEVLGRPIGAFYTPASAKEVYEVNRPLVLTEGRFRDRPGQMLTRQGEVRDVLISAVAEYDAEHRPSRVLVCLVDVTDDLRRRAELQREQRLRLQIERHAAELDGLLRERSEMLDVLAHEVRQPLNNASAALQSAGAALAGSGEAQALERIRRAEGVLGQVLAGVDNTLAAAALLAGAARPARVETEIDTLIAVCIADLPREGRERVRVERATTTRNALMDMSLMRLALRNLLGNALKYSPAAALVTLRVLETEEPLVLVFEVEDGGTGFPPELWGRLFERGVRAGQAAEGTHGLGLFIVRRVMEAHGGAVELAGTGPLGSRLRLSLPQT